jgi:hypothetical protein
LLSRAATPDGISTGNSAEPASVQKDLHRTASGPF